jgi:hypothetical protein
MKISTQNGFWGAVGFAALGALWVGIHAGGPGNRDFTPMLAAFAVALAIFLWPAAKNLYAVWRASLPPRYTSGRARSLPAPDDGAQSRARVLPSPRVLISANGR